MKEVKWNKIIEELKKHNHNIEQMVLRLDCKGCMKVITDIRKFDIKQEQERIILKIEKFQSKLKITSMAFHILEQLKKEISK